MAGSTDGFLEQDKRLSESLLWEINRRYYERRGAASWHSGELPSYATCNTFIARAYAEVVLAYLHDASAAGMIDRREPVYLVELAAGLGRFAYQFVTSFRSLLDASALRGLDVCYVMTDFTHASVAAWRAHPLLGPLSRTLALDFAWFDVDRHTYLDLASRGAHLTAGNVANPVVVLANYAFDSFRQDLFHVERGVLHETVVSLSSPAPVDDLGAPGVLRALRIGHAHREVTLAAATTDAALATVLEGYRSRLPDCTIAVPTSGLRALEVIAALSGGRMLVLASDKGFTHEDELAGAEMQRIEQHADCFSMDVDLGAIGKWCEARGGGYAASERRSLVLRTLAAWTGADAAALAATRAAVKVHVEQFGPGEFFELLQHHRASGAMTVEWILSLVRLSGWEPQVLADFARPLVASVGAADARVQRDVAIAMMRAYASYFPGAQDVPMAFARIAAAMHRPREAIEYALRSIALFGERAEVCAELGEFALAAEDREAARRWITRALALDPGSERARRVLGQLDAPSA